MAVTQMDIAERVGVDQSLVSMVLNKKSTPIKVAKTTRKRIFQAVKEMNYKPNLLARGLAKGKTHTIGFLTGSSILEITSAMVTKLDDFAERFGYEVHTVHTKAEIEMTIERAENLIGRGVDGLIISGSFSSIPPSRLQSKLNFSIPTVLLSLDQPKPFPCRQVYQDSSVGVRQAVNHLYELGHRQIYMLRSEWKGWEKDLRFAGFHETIKKHGLGDPEGRLHGICDFLYMDENGRRVRNDNKIASETEAFLKAHPDCTAILCSADDLALPVLRALTRLGIRVPEDISLVGFGNDPATQYSDPPLSTTQTHVNKLMQSALDMLLDGMGNNNNNPETVVITNEFISRDSTGPARRQATGNRQQEQQKTTAKNKTEITKNTKNTKKGV